MFCDCHSQLINYKGFSQVNNDELSISAVRGRIKPKVTLPIDRANKVPRIMRYFLRLYAQSLLFTRNVFGILCANYAQTSLKVKQSQNAIKSWHQYNTTVARYLYSILFLLLLKIVETTIFAVPAANK